MKEIVEIKGVKMEIDTREATKLESFKVGDRIKILQKEHSDQYKVYAGVIIGFEMFKALPTIVICYLHSDYSGAKVLFKYYNEKTVDFEICMAEEYDVPYQKKSIMDQMMYEINKKREELMVLERNMSYFENNFDKYFSQLLAPETIKGAN